MTLADALQFAGSLGLTVALVPQFFRTLRLGRAQDVDVYFLLLVWVASAILLVYSVMTDQVWFAASFVANLVVWGTVLYYRLRPRPGTVPVNPG